MIISKIYNKSIKKQKEDLVVGLVWGLVWGLVGGLVVGLVVILTNFSEAFPFITNAYQILWIVVGIILIAEIMFWLSKDEKPKKENVYWCVLKRKAENIFEVLLGLSAISAIYVLIREPSFKQYPPYIIKGIGCVGLGLMFLGLFTFIIFVWLRINVLKYRR